MDKGLPPMPSSGTSFWKDNVVEVIPEPKMTKCEHFFKYNKDGVKCNKCNFGLIGHLEIREGKLYSENKKIGL